jgi:hypothetical protein
VGQHKLLLLPLTLVPLCYAPFPLAPALVARLRDAGIETLTQQAPVQDAPGESSISLWIYDSPDRLLGHWQQQADPPAFHQLLEAFQTLLAQPPGAAMISVWRLEQLDPASIRHWLGGLPAQAWHSGTIRSEPPPIDPLVAQLVLTLLQERPAWLESYLDLELKSELAGTSPDSHYLDRLQASVVGDSLLVDWWGLRRMAAEQKILKAEHPRLMAECADLASRLQDMQLSSEESHLLTLQLRQVQQELEHVFLRSKENEQQLQEQAQALRLLNEEHEAEKARCEAMRDERNQLASRLENHQSQGREAKEERELLKLQLQQVQEELERYFLVSREQGVLLDRMDQQLQRALRLLVQAAPQPGPVAPRVLTGAR